LLNQSIKSGGRKTPSWSCSRALSAAHKLAMHLPMKIPARVSELSFVQRGVDVSFVIRAGPEQSCGN